MTEGQKDETGGLEAPPLSLYVHLPWCVRKCPYCDFNSHEAKSEIPFREYSDALISDLEQDLSMVWGRPVSSIYFGGGTPSLFSAIEIDRLLAAFRARLPLSPELEVTLEANPGTIERDSFSAYREAGVNRVSLGVQSFNQNSLQKLGRIHGPDEVHASLESLGRAGMDNFNIDLMFGLPEQELSLAVYDIRAALQSTATHLSHYQLTLEPNTAFAARPPLLPEEDDCWEMQAITSKMMEDEGFEQYEISAWSKTGHQSKHNLNSWRYGDFLGIGAGAHSKLTIAGEGAIFRLAKQRHPKSYLSGDFIAEKREIDDSEKTFEFFLNRLRLREGIAPADFISRTGLSWESLESSLQTAFKKDLLMEKDGKIFHTGTGWRFVNDIQALFLP
jgi:putative oxygen-independent coproporphyrinogen III oxidase